MLSLSWAFIPLFSKQQGPSSTVACRRDRMGENAVTTLYPISTEILGLAHGTTPSTQAHHPQPGNQLQSTFTFLISCIREPQARVRVSSLVPLPLPPAAPLILSHGGLWAVLQERPGCSLSPLLAVCRDHLIQAPEN